MDSDQVGFGCTSLDLLVLDRTLQRGDAIKRVGKSKEEILEIGLGRPSQISHRK